MPSDIKKIKRKFNRLENKLKENELLNEFDFSKMVKKVRPMEKLKLPSHIHLYRRVDLRPKWKQIKHNLPPHIELVCQKPTCSHRMPLAQAIGKLCECNRCHNPMILDKHTITLAKPHCQDCIVRKNKPMLEDINELIKDI